MNTRKRGFTLVELLVVAAVVGVLASLLFPALPMARQDAQREQCELNLRKLAFAAHNYHDMNGAFPNDGYFVVGKKNKEH